MIARIHPAAEAELERVFLYYEAVRPGLGNRFLDEYCEGINQIIQNPKAWQSLDKSYRRYRLRRFLYGVIYREIGDQEFLVTSILHLSRKTKSWRR
jgi:toxin ParE1/3/4